MAATSPYGERPSMQGSFRRSFTAPSRQLSVHEKAGLDKADADADILYSHPNARIISFSPPTDSVKSTSKAEVPADTDYPVDTIETLPWRSRTEALAATGLMIIEKVRGSTNFLKCQGVMHAILRNSQCWCVDGESKFVLRVRKLQYYRIELPSTTDEDKAKVEELKKVLPTVLRFERTPCPFIRAFSVDLPDDAITPRRKGAWKRRDSSQTNTPETETPSLRRTRVERRWSTKTPPTSYPKGGPAYTQDDDRGRPGNAVGMYRRGSLFDSYRNTSPASLGQSEGGTDSEQADSEHDSELDSTTDRSATASPRKQLRSEPIGEIAKEQHTVEPQTPHLAQSALADHVTGATTGLATESTRLIEAGPLNAKDESQSLNSRVDKDPIQRSELEDDVSKAASREAAQPPMSEDINVKQTSDAQSGETWRERSVAKPLSAIAKIHESHAEPNQKISATIEPSSRTGLVSQSFADRNIEKSHDSMQENLISHDEAELLQSSGNTSSTTTDSVDSNEDDESASESELRARSQTHTGPELIARPQVISQHPEHEPHTLAASELSSETESESSSDSESEAESQSGSEVPQAGQNLTTDSVLHTEDVESTESETPSETNSDSPSPDLAQHDQHISKPLPIDTSVANEDNEDDDDLSTVSSADSFHTIASPTQETSDDEVSSALALAVEQRGRFPHVNYQHKRELSEITVTASSMSDPASPVRLRGLQLDGEHTYAPASARSSMPDTSWPEPSIPSSALHNQEGVRERLRARRSFSPLPPASTIFVGSQIRHDSGSGHMTKAILQKVIVKPIEMAILVVHILARIANGATVNDLLSGELFKRPDHQRRVAGFADQANGSRSGSETEDDYGLPVRGRRRSSERRVAMALDENVKNDFEEID